MAHRVLVLEEVLAMLQVVGASPKLQEAFRKQAEAVLGQRNERGDDRMTVSSSFGSTSHRGGVEFTLNDMRTQMDAKKAREVGLWLLEAAEAAMSDEMFVKLLERVGAGDPDTRGRLLMELREIRQGTRDVSWPS